MNICRRNINTCVRAQNEWQLETGKQEAIKRFNFTVESVYQIMDKKVFYNSFGITVKL